MSARLRRPSQRPRLMTRQYPDLRFPQPRSPLRPVSGYCDRRGTTPATWARGLRKCLTVSAGCIEARSRLWGFAARQRQIIDAELGRDRLFTEPIIDPRVSGNAQPSPVPFISRGHRPPGRSRLRRWRPALSMSGSARRVSVSLISRPRRTRPDDLPTGTSHGNARTTWKSNG